LETNYVRVVIVDDDPAVASVVGKMLSSDNRVAVVAIASGADEALDIIERERVDVVVTDLEMPGRDGLSLARALRALPRGPAVLLLTGTALTATQIDDALASGVAAILLKPQSVVRLLEAVLAAASSVL
jgi:CheY-like chemotaxis protein